MFLLVHTTGLLAIIGQNDPIVSLTTVVCFIPFRQNFKIIIETSGGREAIYGPIEAYGSLSMHFGFMARSDCYTCIIMVSEFLSHLRVQYTRFKKKNEIFSYSTSLTGFGKVSPLVIQDLTKDSLTKALVVQNSTRCLKGQMKILSQAKPALQNN